MRRADCPCWSISSSLRATHRRVARMARLMRGGWCLGSPGDRDSGRPVLRGVPSDHLEDLRMQAEYARERYRLYKAKSPRRTSDQPAATARAPAGLRAGRGAPPLCPVRGATDAGRGSRATDRSPVFALPRPQGRPARAVLHRPETKPTVLIALHAPGGGVVWTPHGARDGSSPPPRPWCKPSRWASWRISWRSACADERYSHPAVAGAARCDRPGGCRSHGRRAGRS